MSRKFTGHPYIPNTVPKMREEMLKEIGVEDIEQLYEEIPDSLRLKRSLNVPAPYSSEYEMRRGVQKILSQNTSCEDNLNFLGSGCWQHYVPAVCDEINSRSEFLTAYSAETYADFGKYQAQFEYQSMMGELVGYDVVSSTTYDGACATGSVLLMATRVTGRKQVLVPANLNPEKKEQIANFCQSAAEVIYVDYQKDTGLLDMDDLKRKLSEQTAGVYIENPTYLGVVELNARQIGEMAHSVGALFLVGVDPISLGVMAPPSEYGADVVCGDLQPLGMHMQYGGGQAGFFATRDEEYLVTELPNLMISIAPTEDGEGYAFGNCTYDRTSFVKRDKASDYTGTTSTLWAITAGVYLALMGPQGMREIGETVMERNAYAAEVLSTVSGVNAKKLSGVPFKEIIVNFDGTGKSVAEINEALLEKGIFGGRDLSKDFPELGSSALYCFTEIYSKDDIEYLAKCIKEVVA